MRSCHSRLGNLYSRQQREDDEKKKKARDRSLPGMTHRSVFGFGVKAPLLPLNHGGPCRCESVCSYVCVCNRVQQGGRDCSLTKVRDVEQGNLDFDNVAKHFIDLPWPQT